MPWNLHHTMRREVAQGLQETRKHSRAVENTAASLIPLATDGTKAALEELDRLGRRATELISILYDEIAPLAFGDNPQLRANQQEHQS